MVYCYECGSQVAEIDVFCPYCGITLKSDTGSSDDVSMDKTIFIKGGESSGLPEKAVSEKIETPEIGQTAEPDLESAATTIADEDADTLKEFGKSTADFSNSNTQESFDLKTESVEIPSEVFDNYISQSTDVSAMAVETATEQEAEKVEETEQIEPQIKPSNDFDLPEPKQIEILKPIQETPEIAESETALEEKPVEEIVPQVEEKVEEIAETVSENESFENEPVAEIEPQAETEVANFSEAVVESPADETLKVEENIEIIEPSAEIVEEFPAEPANLTEIETADETPNQDNVQTMIHSSQDLGKGSFFDEIDIGKFDAPDVGESEVAESQSVENISVIEPPISKPEIELEEAETPESAAVFDSVQIVQTDKREDGFEEKVAAVEAENVSAEPLPEIDSENKAARSYTTPNIGVENTDGKKATKLKPLDEGTVLNNRYEIVRKIGGGGMGAVYLASDKNLGGVLRAVKEMVQSYIEEVQQDKAVNDFKRESLLLTSLEHTAIPTIYDYFFDDKEGRFYLVMKYISGGDLAGRLRASTEGKIDEQTVTEWGIQIADVLDYLHNREPSIVYRDLKPANIMIDGNSGRLMLIDFGIARWINKEEKGVTAVGTMGYAPPELFSGNVEPRSDIYSLGSTLFHLLTGADPQSNPLLIFDFQKNPHPRQINPSLSDQIERILMRSVEYSADKRFESAAELKKSLEEHLENLKSGKVTFGVKETPASQTLSEQLVFCGFCGQKIVASDMFCAFCGSKQPLAQQGVHASPYASHAATAKLILLNTEEFDAPQFSLEKESNFVGRRDPMSNIFPEVDLSKFDPQTKISRRHARIWREGNNYMVEDLGSSNGTVLLPSLSDTVRLLPHQPHLLTNGDKIKVGDTTMSFIVG